MLSVKRTTERRRGSGFQWRSEVGVRRGDWEERREREDEKGGLKEDGDSYRVTLNP